MGPCRRLGCPLALTALGVLAHLYPWLRAGDRCGASSLYKVSLAEGVRLQYEPRLGSTPFANESLYRSLDNLSFTAEDHAAFAAEGYLVLKNLLPPETLTALREALLAEFGSSDHGHNGWLSSGALLDFLTFGPFGRVASELLGGGPAHLLYSVHHFRQAGMVRNTPTLHYDTIECEDGVLSAQQAERSGIKFYVPLYDKRPAMWFVNQSATERMLHGWGNDSLVSRFLAGELPHLWQWDFVKPDVLQQVAEAWRKPVLDLGDVIVHTPCIFHRSAEESGGVAKALVLPTYASPKMRYAGRFNFERRQCESGVDPATAIGAAPPVEEVPNPGCYPRVFPVEAARARVGAPSRAAFRGNELFYPAQWYWERWRTAVECAKATAPEEPPPVVGMELPSSNIKALSLEGAAAARAPGRPAKAPRAAKGAKPEL